MTLLTIIFLKELKKCKNSVGSTSCTSYIFFHREKRESMRVTPPKSPAGGLFSLKKRKSIKNSSRKSFFFIKRKKTSCHRKNKSQSKKLWLFYFIHLVEGKNFHYEKYIFYQLFLHLSK